MVAYPVYAHAFGANNQPLHAEDYAMGKMLEQVGHHLDGHAIFMAVYGRPSQVFPRARPLAPCTDGQSTKATGCASCAAALEVSTS